jgi:hypothetical protein
LDFGLRGTGGTATRDRGWRPRRSADLAKATADSYDYLVFLRQAVSEFMEAGGGIEDVGSIDQSRFSYLANYEALKGRNAQRVFEELEWE